MAAEETPRNRDSLAADIRRFRHKGWGTQPTSDGRWECYFDIAETRGGRRLRSYGANELESMDTMLEILTKEGIESS